MEKSLNYYSDTINRDKLRVWKAYASHSLFLYETIFAFRRWEIDLD